MIKVNLWFDIGVCDDIFLMRENRWKGGVQNNILRTGDYNIEKN